MKHKHLVILVLMLLVVVSGAFAAIGDYRTKATGNWNALTTWERHDGTNWAEPTSGEGTPTNASGVITILSPNTVTVTANVSVDQVTVDNGAQITINTGITLTLSNGAASTDMSVSGIIKNTGTITTTGTLVFANGGKYQHNWASGGVGEIPIATWSDGSTCEIIGFTSGGATTKLQGTNQSFYDFIWNCPGQTQPVYIRGDSFRPVRHDFKMLSTGTSNCEVSAVEPGAPWRLDLTNYIQSGGKFTIERTNTSYDVNISGDFNMSGGTLDTSGTTSSRVNFTKTGTQTFTKTAGTITGRIDFVVKSGAILDMGTNVLNSASTTCTFNLNAGAGLITANTAGITSSGATGSVQVSGTRTYNAAANYTFNGTAAQATGNGLSTANNITINNAAGVTLTNSITVNGTLTQTAGAISGTRTVDGYAANPYNYVLIDENGINMSGFALSTTIVSGNMPDKITRQWSITQTGASLNKDITYYWDAADDDNFVWGSLVPAVWKGTTKYTPSAANYNVSASPRWVKITNIPITSSKDTYTIGRDDEITLPVELSSFSAVLTADFFVKLHWTTQSETGVSGFYIYRGLDSDIADAVVVSPMLEAHNTGDQQHYEYIDNELYESATYYYWLAVQNMGGGVDYHGPTTVYYSNSANQGAPGIPVVSGLQSVYPNPFNPTATISYGLSKDGAVDFTIYNVRGQIVRNFSDGQKAAGNWKVFWNGLDNSGNACSTGVYYIKMQAGKDSFMRKAVLMK